MMGWQQYRMHKFITSRCEISNKNIFSYKEKPNNLIADKEL